MRSPAAAVRRCIAPPAMADELWNSNDDFALTEYIARHQSAARCGAPGRVLGDLEEAWVLIFNVGKQDEGVYTLQGRTERAAAYVLMFEFTDDADRFAQLLQAEGFEGATPLKWAAEQIHAFCLAGEFEVSLVPQGALITPPTKNEYDLDAFERLNDPEGAAERAAVTSDAADAAPDPDALDAFAAQRAQFEKMFNNGGESGGAPGGTVY